MIILLEQYPALFEILLTVYGPLLLLLVGGFLAGITAAGVALGSLLTLREILP